VETYQYYVSGKLERLPLQLLRERLEISLTATREAIAKGLPEKPGLDTVLSVVQKLVMDKKSTFSALFHDQPAAGNLFTFKSKRCSVIATECLFVEGAKNPALTWLRDKYGMKIVDELGEGGYLLQAPEGAKAGIRLVFAVARACIKQGGFESAQPNFLRLLDVPVPAPMNPAAAIDPATGAGLPAQWNLHNNGFAGVAGADVRAHNAWTITRGSKDIRVAVIDDGVDANHPALKNAVAMQKDFWDTHKQNALPVANDAHGTHCAGIIASRAPFASGLAPECSLVAIRALVEDPNSGNLIVNDCKVPAAIRWAWNEAKADVLNLSWGGGPPVDCISRAIKDAATKGRKGLGCIVAVAAGNDDGPVDFPATMAQVLAVGASNAWDERKTAKSQDGDTTWASARGKELDLLAPGAFIVATDPHGQRGNSSTDYVEQFSGTSAAAPHVAATAALILSIKPKLTGKQVSNIITSTADKLPPQKRHNHKNGHGRLNAHAALLRA